MNFTINQWNYGYKTMYLTHNEGKSVVDERFIRSLNNKIYEYVTSTLNNLYIEKLHNIS